MNIALILSGGQGIRFCSDTPKQYITIEGKPIISYCLETMVNHSMIDCIQIVADNKWHDFILNEIHSDKFKGFSKPGKTRQLSIYNGLTDILKYADDNDCVLIHDAARPLVSDDLVKRCIESTYKHDGVLPVLPMKDTLYYSEDVKTISSLLSREKIFAGQAPEAFNLGKYFKANYDLMPDRILEINGSSEPAVIAGMDIAIIEGEESNFKITTKADMDKFLMLKGSDIK